MNAEYDYFGNLSDDEEQVLVNLFPSLSLDDVQDYVALIPLPRPVECPPVSDGTEGLR